jgi:hypothetical protein
MSGKMSKKRRLAQAENWKLATGSKRARRLEVDQELLDLRAKNLLLMAENSALKIETELKQSEIVLKQSEIVELKVRHFPSTLGHFHF